MSSATAFPIIPRKNGWAFVCGPIVRMLHFPVACPSTLLLVVLGLTIFHPPDFHFFYIDRIAVAFLFEQRYLVFPRYILNECIGYHADRARGPFLQAVANGVALNLLGLLVLNAFQRKRLPGWTAAALGIVFPLAILATKTRAVWAGFAASMIFLTFRSPSRRLRRFCGCLIGVSATLLLVGAVLISSQASFVERVREESPVDFRAAVYQAGAVMFLQRPLFGWDSGEMQAELSRQVSDFHQDELYFHNTFLEILVNCGLVGFALYLWLMVGLFRLGRPSSDPRSRNCSVLDVHFRKLWPIFLLVYFFNAMFVGMNYQFVNALVFTLAGILAADNGRCVALRRG